MRAPSKLHADGLLLRRLTAADAESLHEAVESSREHLRPFIPSASTDPADLEFRRNAIVRSRQRWDAGTSFSYGIFNDSELIGECRIDRKSATNAAIGYWVHVAHTRNGYATAVARTLTNAAFAIGFSTVVLRHDRANEASAAIARKLGFEFVREEPHSIDAPGQTGTSVVWRIDSQRRPA